MKKIIHVCDLCEKNEPDAKIKYRYRAKHIGHDFYGSSWYRIELCEECLTKIITKKDMKDILEEEK